MKAVVESGEEIEPGPAIALQLLQDVLSPKMRGTTEVKVRVRGVVSKVQD
jgi:hypothetical protein